VKKVTLEQAQAKQAKLKTAYRLLFEQPNAQMVLEDLNEKFNQNTLRKKDGVIEPYASIAAAGCREVLLYIDWMMRNNDATTE